jgi:hypothetical protein
MAKTNLWSWQLIIKMTFFVMLIIVASLFVFSLLGSSVTKNLDTYTYNRSILKKKKRHLLCVSQFCKKEDISEKEYWGEN